MQHNNKQNNTMKDQTSFDLGSTLVDVSVEKATFNDRLLFTFYVNGASIRSHNLHLPAVRDRMLSGVWLLSGADEDQSVTAHIRAWIDCKVETNRAATQKGGRP